MPKHSQVIFFLLAISLTLTGCQSTPFSGLFSGYSKQMEKSRSAQLSGDFMKAESLVDTVNSSHNDYGLSQLEKGRLQFLANNWPASQGNFEHANEQVQAQDEAAKVQLSKGVKKLTSVVTNDNAIPYEIPRYEQGMLHTYQALNYLYQGDMEGSLVEVRKANLVQERALKENEAVLSQAQADMSKQGVSSAKLNAAYPSMKKTIGDLKNGFQNAYTFYLSGILWEAAGEPNSAYIDYKRAIEIYPDNTYLQRDVLRLAAKLGMADDLASFEQQFGKYENRGGRDMGQIAIVLEQGIVNAKDEVKISLPIISTSSHHRGHRSSRSIDSVKFFSFALPVYRDELHAARRLVANIDGSTYESEIIVRLQSLAARELKDKLPGLVVRQALRIIAKEQVRQEMASRSDAANVITSIFNIASENADTRSWSSLPNNVQILRLNTAVGEHRLQLSIQGQQEVVDVEVRPGRITLINLTSIGNYTGYRQVNL